MKKIAAMLLAVLLAVTVVGASAENMLAGGWRVAENAEITEEYRAVFDQAMEGFLAVNYEPIAYLGSQVVAGRNHCFLCRATVVYPNALPTLALVYVYEDLQGGASVIRIAELDIAAFSQPQE